jgi:hypothetical protein
MKFELIRQIKEKRHYCYGSHPPLLQKPDRVKGSGSLGFSAHYDRFTGASSTDSGRPMVRWWSRSSWGGSLTHSESMGGGWEDRGSLGQLVDGKAVGGEAADDGGSDQWLPE